MGADKIIDVRVPMVRPPNVECPVHKTALREALLCKAEAEPMLCKWWYSMTGAVGSHRKQLVGLGGMLVLLVFVNGGMGETTLGRTSYQEKKESIAIQRQIVSSIGELDARDVELLKEKTGSSIDEIEDQVVRGNGFVAVGVYKMSPQLVWDLGSEGASSGARMFLSSVGGGDRVVADQVGSNQVEIKIVDFEVEGEMMRLGLTTGDVPLYLWER